MTGTQHSDVVVSRFVATKPGFRERISRFPRLDPRGYCPTLRAGTDSAHGSFQAVRPIHPTQNRVITPREAARLQGFPDWYTFHETKWHAFRQIGNSVSPLIAEHLLLVIRSKLWPEEGMARSQDARERVPWGEARPTAAPGYLS